MREPAPPTLAPAFRACTGTVPHGLTIHVRYKRTNGPGATDVVVVSTPGGTSDRIVIHGLVTPPDIAVLPDMTILPDMAISNDMATSPADMAMERSAQRFKRVRVALSG